MFALRLIVGLGNPGVKYQHTRHNVGADCVALWAQTYALCLHLDARRFASLGVLDAPAQAEWGGSLPDRRIHMMIPQVYMNESGRAVRAVCRFYRIEPASVLVLHDELDFPPGKVRLKFGGGHGGHNGIRDIIAQLGTRAFGRLRIGIGHPGRGEAHRGDHKEQVSRYVLSRPRVSEDNAIHAACLAARHILPALVQGDREKAMRELHSMDMTG